MGHEDALRGADDGGGTRGRLEAADGSGAHRDGSNQAASAEQPTCSATSTTKEGWRVLTCDYPSGHDEPHSDPDSRAGSNTGFWWSR